MIRVFAICVVVMLVVAAFATSGLAQCAMCRAALAGSNNAAFIRNLNLGVLILLVPPVTMFCSIFVALRRTKAKDEEGFGDTEDNSPD
jgi:hypothetical protein